MLLKEIRLKNFRNYKDEAVGFSEKVNVILGRNGQGKSNLLEGINMLSMGKSFRTARASEMIMFGEPFFSVSGLFEKEGRELSIEAAMSLDEKRFKVDGRQFFKNADLLENAYIVVFSPEDLSIVKEEPEVRRRFIDRELFQIRPLYYKDLSRYKKSLMQRNALIKEEAVDRRVLDAWDESLINYGSRVLLERRRFVGKLKAVSARLHSAITGGGESIDIVYESGIAEAEGLDGQKGAYAAKLEEYRDRDIARGYTSQGPHRDDLKIFLGGREIRAYGSQGQQRTAALALKLAEIQIIKDETGEDAIVLLDDVLSELDGERQSFLIKSFSANQIFISAAESGASIGGFIQEGRPYIVEGGKISH